jgi:hypothetical protein
MSKDGAGDTVLTIELPDPDHENVRHLVSVDTENEESLVDFLYSLLEIYGDEGEDIAAQILGLKAFTWAIFGGLVREGKLVRVGDRYFLPTDAGLPH